MMRVVVSANYRDRGQKNWLVRKQEDSIDNFELRDRVVVRDFEFCKSHAGEAGFGCTVVAVGEIDESAIAPENLVQIVFDLDRFEEKESQKKVTGGSLLYLDETGMYYLPA